MTAFRTELRRAVQQRYKRVDLDRFKQEIKEHATHYLYEYTQRSPIVIPVVNVVGGKPTGPVDKNQKNKDQAAPKSPEQVADEQQKRFQEMRARLLGQDPRND